MNDSEINSNQTLSFEDSEFRALNRKRLLKGLFYETTSGDKSSVLYTLKFDDHLGFRSLPRLYTESVIEDPTEYNFATAYLESYDHWEYLCSATWFKPHLQKWRKEAEMKFKSLALSRMIREAKDPKSMSRFSANKFLLEKGWEPKEGQGRGKGRPSKEDISAAAYDLASADKRLAEDYERLSSIKVN